MISMPTNFFFIWLIVSVRLVKWAKVMQSYYKTFNYQTKSQKKLEPSEFDWVPFSFAFAKVWQISELAKLLNQFLCYKTYFIPYLSDYPHFKKSKKFVLKTRQNLQQGWNAAKSHAPTSSNNWTNTISTGNDNTAKPRQKLHFVTLYHPSATLDAPAKQARPAPQATPISTIDTLL